MTSTLSPTEHFEEAPVAAPVEEATPTSTKALEAAPAKVIETPVSSLFAMTMSAYGYGKTLAVAQYPSLESAIETVEAQLVKASAQALKTAKVDDKTLADIVAKIDSKALEYIKYYQVAEKVEGLNTSLKAKKQSALTPFQRRILALKTGEDAALVTVDDEIALLNLIADARAVAWTQAEVTYTNASTTVTETYTKVEQNVADRADALLDASEATVEKYLPPVADDEAEFEDATSEEDAKLRTTRVKQLSSKVSRRVKKRVVDSLAGVTLRLRAAADGSPLNQIVHLDLVKYAELLDVAAIRERVESTATLVANIKPVEVAQGLVVRATTVRDALAKRLREEAAKRRGEAEQIFQVRILTPANNFYEVATAEFVRLVEAGKASSMEHRVKLKDFLAKLAESLGDTWSEKLKHPAEQYYELLTDTFTKEYAEYKAAPDLKTFVTAVSERLAESFKDATASTATKQ